MQDFDVEYMPVSRSPRGRGRGSARVNLASPGHHKGAEIVTDDEQLQSDDDVVTVDSVKLGKRFASARHSVCLITNNFRPKTEISFILTIIPKHYSLELLP